MHLQMNSQQKAKEYDALQSSVMTAARRGYVDLILDPADTRKYLVDAFELLYTKMCRCTGQETWNKIER